MSIKSPNINDKYMDPHMGAIGNILTGTIPSLGRKMVPNLQDRERGPKAQDRGNVPRRGPKRVELFNTLVLTKMLYGADSWVAMDLRTFHKFEAGVYRLYKRLLSHRPDAHLSDHQILEATGLPAPIVLLRRARLRYLTTLFHCGLDQVWLLLGEDHPWIQLIEDDMLWMWQQLQHASSLQDPRTHVAQWYGLLQYHPRYWKRLIARACRHDTLQRTKHSHVVDFHHRIFRRFRAFCHEHGLSPPDDLQQPRSSAIPYGCMGCGLKCLSKAGEGAHMFKKHGQVSHFRRLFDTTQCRACLKDFHTYGKMKAHLYYSEQCRRQLLSLPPCTSLPPGMGSTDDNALVAAHDRCLPPLQVPGPLPPPVRLRVHSDIDDDLHIFMVDLLANTVGDSWTPGAFEQRVRAWISGHALSWTRTSSTLRFFADSLQEDDAALFGFELHSLKETLLQLADPLSWPFLCAQKEVTADMRHIADCHSFCSTWTQFFQHQPVPAVPPPFGRLRIILHAFAGRRRPGDLQYYLERDIPTDASYTLVTVSLDIVIDATWGNVMRAETRALWIAAIRDKYVVGFIAGPPCETWSRVRGVVPSDHAAPLPPHAHGSGLPRALRDLSALWGFEALSLRELCQVDTGNQLLCFSLEALVEIAMAGSVGLLEHPAEPTDLPENASIWRLPVMAALDQLPGVRRHRFAQGLMGTKTVKATDLLCINLPTVMMDLHAHRVRTELPKGQSLGKDASGRWRTATLKEYAPAMCKALSHSFHTAFRQSSAAVAGPAIPDHFYQLCLSMQAVQFGNTIGGDFAGPF